MEKATAQTWDCLQVKGLRAAPFPPSPPHPLPGFHTYPLQTGPFPSHPPTITLRCFLWHLLQPLTLRSLSAISQRPLSPGLCCFSRSLPSPLPRTHPKPLLSAYIGALLCSPHLASSYLVERPDPWSLVVPMVTDALPEGSHGWYIAICQTLLS